MTREKLDRLVRSAGFDAFGVARAERAPHAEEFHGWLQEGFHASMGWLEREPEKRCSPGLLLPEARSLIMLAVNYLPPGHPEKVDGTTGVIARYARGRDYHNFLPKRLKAIAAGLAAQGGIQRTFVDSGPLLERDFAVKAGLGWCGKSTMVLNRELGTWFFLAVILTTLEIDADEPVAGRCGSCVRCLDACPTGAIVAPYRLDARRCLAYWTIEHRGSLPLWVRPLLGARVFGCDDCLEVCPWNRFARESRDANFHPRMAGAWPLRDFLTLDEAGFRRVFEGSPVRRAGRQGFLRNACVALGNIGHLEDRRALEQSAGDPDPVVAEHAQWALGRMCAREGENG